MNPENEYELYFDRNDKDTWAMARLHHSLLKQIENSPVWEKEEVPDIPLSEEQMVIFTTPVGKPAMHLTSWAAGTTLPAQAGG